MLADNKQLDFASFLDVLHDHSMVENCQKELEAALVAHDRSRSGYVSAADIRQILTSMGERLSRNEGEMRPLALSLSWVVVVVFFFWVLSCVKVWVDAYVG